MRAGLFMEVRCENCFVIYNFSETLLDREGNLFRCLNCKNVFKIFPSSGYKTFQESEIFEDNKKDKITRHEIYSDDFKKPEISKTEDKELINKKLKKTSEIIIQKTEPEVEKNKKSINRPIEKQAEIKKIPEIDTIDLDDKETQIKSSASLFKNKLFSNLKGDLSGSISAAIITLPMSIGYGIIAYAAMGMEFASEAALIGIYSAVFSGFFASLLGGTPIQITGPKAPLTLITASVVASLAASIPEGVVDRQYIIIGLASMCVLFAGIIQVLFGILRFGSIVKFVPFPVVSGFMNGIAFLLIFKQFKPILGINTKISFIEIFNQNVHVQPLTILVGLTTIFFLFSAKGRIKIIPASLVGLLSGTALYYSFYFFTGPEPLGPIVGYIKIEWPKPDAFYNFFIAAQHVEIMQYLPSLIISAFVLALLASMESLLSSVVSDNMTDTRHDSSQELIGQGVGNIANACFGAIAGAGSVPRAMANYNAGGRTRLSGMMCGIAVFAIIMTMGPLVGRIPMAAISGIIISVGISMFDSWTMNLFRKLTAPAAQRRDALLNLSITLTVAIVTVSVNIIVAVGIGIGIACALFISKLGKSIIKRKYFGDKFHSKKMRSVNHSDFLEKKGNKIVVYELQGPLFFGSSENFATQIENDIKNEHINYCIIDTKRLTEIDSTGANVLIQIKKTIQKEGKFLLFSYLKNNATLWGLLKIMDITEHLEDNLFFQDTDAALEWSEDHLIEHSNEETGSINEVPLNEMEIVRDFTNDELDTLDKRLIRLTYKSGENIFREGDPGRDLFILTKGAVTVKIQLRESNILKRLFTFTSGVIFGEIALLDGKPRSADIWAEEDAEVYKLSVDDFEFFRKEMPEIAIKLIMNIARTLTRHLRRSSETVRALEDS